MKTNQNIVHGFHVGLASQSSAMFQAILAIRACHSELRMVAKAAWAATWLMPLFCWLMRSLLSQQSASLCLPHAMWCLHQHQVSLDFLLVSFSLLWRGRLPIHILLLLALVSVVLLVLLVLLVLVIASTLLLSSCLVLCHHPWLPWPS